MYVRLNLKFASDFIRYEFQAKKRYNWQRYDNFSG